MRSAKRLPSAVVDTNIFVSGLITRSGPPFEVLEAWRAGDFVIVVTEAQKEEIARVLHRPGICGKYAISLDDIAALLALLDSNSVQVEDADAGTLNVRDEKDEMILASAVDGRADFLVTGDHDLLCLKDDPALGSLRLVAAKEFIAFLRGKGVEG